MILADLFGDTTRVRILEELVSNWGVYLKASEIARMGDVSEKSVYTHINKLNNIGLLEKIEGKSNKYRLKEKDKRALALSIIDNAEYLRKDEEYSFHNVELSNAQIQNEVIVNPRIDYNNTEFHIEVDSNFSARILCGGN